MVTEYGEMPEERAELIRAEVSAEQDADLRGATDVLSATPAAQKTAWQKVVHRDPAFLEVSGTRVQLRFNHNGSCATRLGYTVNRIRLVATGWIFEGGTTTRQDLCSEIWVRDVASFGNPIFCTATPLPGGLTSTSYSNRVRGLPNGYVGYNYSSAKYGGCTWLLHFHRVTSH